MGADRDLITLFEHDLFENPIAAFWDHSIAAHLLNGGCLRIWRLAPDVGAGFQDACRSPPGANVPDLSPASFGASLARISPSASPSTACGETSISMIPASRCSISC